MGQLAPFAANEPARGVLRMAGLNVGRGGPTGRAMAVTPVEARARVAMRLGPAAAGDVVAFVDDALVALEVSGSGLLGWAMPFSVGPEFFDANRSAVLEFGALAQANLANACTTFVWDGEVDPDEVHTIVLYWHNLAMVRRDLLDQGMGVWVEEGAARFGRVLREALLEVLVRAVRMTADKAARMVAAWPDLCAPAPVARTAAAAAAAAAAVAGG